MSASSRASTSRSPTSVDMRSEMSSTRAAPAGSRRRSDRARAPALAVVRTSATGVRSSCDASADSRVISATAPDTRQHPIERHGNALQFDIARGYVNALIEPRKVIASTDDVSRSTGASARRLMSICRGPPRSSRADERHERPPE